MKKENVVWGPKRSSPTSPISPVVMAPSSGLQAGPWACRLVTWWGLAGNMNGGQPVLDGWTMTRKLSVLVFWFPEPHTPPMTTSLPLVYQILLTFFSCDVHRPWPSDLYYPTMPHWYFSVSLVTFSPGVTWGFLLTNGRFLSQLTG